MEDFIWEDVKRNNGTYFEYKRSFQLQTIRKQCVRGMTMIFFYNNYGKEEKVFFEEVKDRSHILYCYNDIAGGKYNETIDLLYRGRSVIFYGFYDNFLLLLQNYLINDLANFVLSFY